MRSLIDWVDSVLLNMRARRDPAKFIERAAWHLVPINETFYEAAPGLLLIAAEYIKHGEEIPAWLFQRSPRCS
jgi:hypothetical protein